MKAVVLGCGLQGVAVAYDLLRWGQASHLLLVDSEAARLKAAARRLTRLLSLKSGILDTAVLDLRKEESIVDALLSRDVVVSAVPYYLNLGATRAAVRARVHFCDLGGNTELVRQQLELHEQAQAAGIAVVPDCGLMPGMGTTLAMGAIDRVPRAETVRIFVGGLPQQPLPPLNYKLVFNIEGLTNEYDGPVYVLRDGAVQQAECLGELEVLEVPGVGTLEAFMTSGGTSTVPWSLEGKLKTLEEKTLRYPGHCQQIRLLRDLGFLSQQPVRLGRSRVVPRQVFHAVVGPKIDFPDVPDMVVLRVDCEGEQGGQPVILRKELIDRADAETGFSAMQRTTGFSAAIVAGLLARGSISPGAIPLERSVPADLFIEQLRKRGFDLREQWLRP